jgi:hypothetical protein
VGLDAAIDCLHNVAGSIGLHHDVRAIAPIAAIIDSGQRLLRQEVPIVALRWMVT